MKPVEESEQSSKLPSIRIPTGGMNLESFSRDYGANVKALNDSQNYMMHPYPAQNAYPIHQYPQYPHQANQMTHQMMPPMQQSMQRPNSINQSLNYGKGQYYQNNQLYNQVLPANISALNLSHQQSSMDSFNQANLMQRQMKSMYMANQQNMMNSSQFSSSNGSFDY